MANKRADAVEIHGSESYVAGVVVMGSSKTGYVVDINLTEAPFQTLISKEVSGRTHKYFVDFVFRVPTIDGNSIRRVSVGFKTSVDLERALTTMDKTTHTLVLAKRDHRLKKVIVPGSTKKKKVREAGYTRYEA